MNLTEIIDNNDIQYLQAHFSEFSPAALMQAIQSPAYQTSTEAFKNTFAVCLTSRIDEGMLHIANIFNDQSQLNYSFQALLNLTDVLEAIKPLEGRQARYYAHCSLGHSYSIQMRYQEALDTYLQASKINPDGTTALAGMISTSTILALEQSKEAIESHAKTIYQHFIQSKPLQQNKQMREMIDFYLKETGNKLSFSGNKLLKNLAKGSAYSLQQFSRLKNTASKADRTDKTTRKKPKL